MTEDCDRSQTSQSGLIGRHSLVDPVAVHELIFRRAAGFGDEGHASRDWRGEPIKALLNARWFKTSNDGRDLAVGNKEGQGCGRRLLL